LSSDTDPRLVLSQLVGKGIQPQNWNSLGSVNVNRMVEECAMQPHLYACVCKILGESKNDLRKKRAEYELTKSEVEAQMRKNPEIFGLPGKITETAIASAVLREDIVISVRMELICAESRVDAANALVGVFDQKRSMLDNEVKMLVSQHYHEEATVGQMSSELVEDKITRKRSEQKR